MKNFIKKLLKNLRVKSLFIGNISGADLADMQLKEFFSLLYVIDIYSKYAWDVLLKDKWGIKITNAKNFK